MISPSPVRRNIVGSWWILVMTWIVHGIAMVVGVANEAAAATALEIATVNATATIHLVVGSDLMSRSSSIHSAALVDWSSAHSPSHSDPLVVHDCSCVHTYRIYGSTYRFDFVRGRRRVDRREWMPSIPSGRRRATCRRSGRMEVERPDEVLGLSVSWARCFLSCHHHQPEPDASTPTSLPDGVNGSLGSLPSLPSLEPGRGVGGTQ